MMEPNSDERLNAVTGLLADLYEVEAVVIQANNLTFRLTSRYPAVKSRKLIEDRLQLAGHRYRIHDEGEGLLLSIDPHRRIRIPILNIALFLLTVLSVYLVPVFFDNYFDALDIVGRRTAANGQGALDKIAFIAETTREAASLALSDLADGAGIEFTLALMSILLFHEMGHFIASRRRGIITSWPYFIPAPNIIGTFGAVIKSKSPFWNRRDLLEVGAAGPIAGWILAVGWFAYGLINSHPESVDSLAGFDVSVGPSLITWLSVKFVVGSISEGYYLPLSEAAFAGWVGFLVTAINLLPIGQLDGGHILYGLFQRKQFWLARASMAALVLLGFLSSMWWLFALFGFVFGVKHPPTLNDDRPPGSKAELLGWISLAIMVLSFTPIPFGM